MQHQKKTKKRSKKRKNTNHYQKNNRLTIYFAKLIEKSKD